jgi:hypothetical protein
MAAEEAAEEKDPKLKANIQKQAEAYGKLAGERAKQYNLMRES